MKRESKKLIICTFLIFIFVLVMLLGVPHWITLSAIDENPFDYIRETEEQHILNDTIDHVEFVNEDYGRDDYCILVLNGGQYRFDTDAYGQLKSHEGMNVSIICYSQGWDGLLRLYPCDSDRFPMGGIKTL